MKTIIVIYTNTKITAKAELARYKKYSFNTSNDLKVGDLIKTNTYTTNMQVVKVLDCKYEYFNGATGELSDSYTSTNQWEIRDLIIRDDSETAVYGSIIE